MGSLVAGEGGAVLVEAARGPAPSVVVLEGLAEPGRTPGGVPAYPMEALRGGSADLEVGVEDVRLVDGEQATREAVGAWAEARRLPVEPGGPPHHPSPPGVRMVAVSSASTGSGKSGLVLRLSRLLRLSGVPVAVARHPLANLLLWEGRERPFVARGLEDLMAPRPYEELEELVPIVEGGAPVVTGLDPSGVVRAAARTCGPGGVVVWDGGGSAHPWVRSDLHILCIDLLRPAPDDLEERVREADVLVLTKADTAPPEHAKEIERRVQGWSPEAPVLVMDMLPSVSEGQRLMDRRVVIVEDWPSLVLGGLRAGAGAVAARRFRCGVVDPRPYAVGAVAELLEEHTHIGPVVPSIGRTLRELADLRATLEQMPGDVILWASPAPPDPVVGESARPVIRVRPELMEVAGGSLQGVVTELLPSHREP